jgi:phosphate:Na+ symporter
MISTILGGIGLFLLGMVLLTDGLKAVAGEALRSVLVRFTGGPLRAMASGAGVTAIVQSSSATVLTTIGFVSAGLLTFPQAVGVIFGANLGTTSTGWIVSLVGLRFSMSVAALPIVGVGALLRLLARGRAADAGLALAGFGLIFVGIDVLQGGMSTLATRIDPASLPGGRLADSILLVGVGMVMTVVMQASSAAVATTLAALHTGAITIDQAAALVVGTNIGTTVKAALAAIGASTAVRRTALAHILFNVITGVVAFLLIPLVLVVNRHLAQAYGADSPAVVIAGFHTAFNLLGVLILFPFIGRFSRLVERLVPERGPVLTRHLDAALATMPAVAVEAARRTTMEIAAALLDALDGVLARPGARPAAAAVEAADAALGETRRFLALVHTANAPGDHERHLAVLHSIDHLDRLVERLRSSPPAAAVGPELSAAAAHARQELEPARRWLGGEDDGTEGGTGEEAAAAAETLTRNVAERRRVQRIVHLQAAAGGELDPDTAMAWLDAMRWLDASVYHVSRVVHHLATHGADTQAEART